MPNTTTNTAVNPSKLDVFLTASDREIDYDKFNAEKQEDIRGNVSSGMIDHDAVADVEGAEAIHRILLGDEDLDTGLVEGKEALDINTEAMREAIIADDSFSAPDTNKYLRTMQIVESIQDKGFSIVRTDSGRYWIESKENGKREYAINAIQEVADLLDKYVVDDATPEDTPKATPHIDGDDQIPGANTNIVLPGDNTNIKDYVPEDTDLSGSDLFYLSAIGVDLVSTMAGLGVKVTTTAPSAGLGYVGGAAISIGGGIASTILGAIGDIENDDVTTGQAWGNVLISLGLEATEAVTSVPLGLTKNVIRAVNPIKKLIRYGMSLGLVTTAASMEWDRLLSKEGEWTANDYRELATLGQFVLSGVSSYVAGRHGKRVLQRQAGEVKTKNATLLKSKKKSLGESADYKKIISEGDNTRKKITLETEKQAKLRAKKETDVIAAESEAKRVKINSDTEAEIAKISNKKSKAKTEKSKQKFADDQAKKIEDITAKRRSEIEKLDTELRTKTASVADRHMKEGMSSPEHLNQIKETKKIDRSRKKDYVAGMDETKAINANKARTAAMGENYSTMVGKKQRQETDAEMYSEAAGKKAPEGASKKEAKLVEKKSKKEKASHDSYGKKRSERDAKKRQAQDEAKDKAEVEDKKANTAARKVIAKQRAELADLEIKKATADGLTAAEQTNYAKLKTSVDKYDAKAAKPKSKSAKLMERANNKRKAISSKIGDKRNNLASSVYRHTGMTNDMTTSSSIAKVSKQYLAYGTNLTGDRIDKMDLRAARKTAERLGFKKNEIGKYTLRELQAAIKARTAEDKKKRLGGRLVQKFRKAGVIPMDKPEQPISTSPLLIRKFQGGEKIEDATTISDEKLKAAVRVFDNYAFSNVRQLDNYWNNKIPAGVKLTPEQSNMLSQAYDTKVAELGLKADVELSKANPMAKWKPLLNNIKPSDLFMRNKMFTEVPVRKDVSAPVLRARPESNLASYNASINSTYKQPRVDGDSMTSNLMKLRFANAGARKRQEINASNDAHREQQKNQANAVTNQNIAGAVQAQNQNNLAYNQASDTYAQERVKAKATQQTLRNKQWGHVGNSLQRAGVQMVNQRGKEELGKKINSLAGLHQIYRTEYAPLVDAAVKANNPIQATYIKQSFMNKHKRNPDMLNVDMLNLSDEMKLFDT